MCVTSKAPDARVGEKKFLPTLCVCVCGGWVGETCICKFLISWGQEYRTLRKSSVMPPGDDFLAEFALHLTALISLIYLLRCADEAHVVRFFPLFLQLLISAVGF